MGTITPSTRQSGHISERRAAGAILSVSKSSKIVRRRNGEKSVGRPECRYAGLARAMMAGIGAS
jgi:hypothetical protein